MADVPPGLGSSAPKESIHSLHLYVHAGDLFTAEILEAFLVFVMIQTEEDGEGWAVLWWGLKVSFFQYARGVLRVLRLKTFRGMLLG